ncbi:MAG: hypothetical protein HY094_01010 [Candidatus Melainabacteria bacterium]|nr:hypothetical protein [Candidatus Melainabacteria bacterium]
MKLVKKLIETTGNMKLFIIFSCFTLFLISLTSTHAFQINNNASTFQEAKFIGSNEMSFSDYKKFLVIVEDSSKTSSTNLTNSEQEEDSTEESDELNELDKSNIKTNIYKSNDPSFELIDDNTKFNSNAETDILKKEDLLEMSNPHKHKIVKRYKNDDSNNVNASVNNKSYMILPWLVSLVLILLLSIIFKVLLQKKV